MTYIVLDLEFNQAYDFINNCPINTNNFCKFEIIQIGAVKLNKKFEIVDTFNSYIKPIIYPKINPYVENLTAIKTEILQNKPYFKDAFFKFLEFIGNKEDTTICVWGSNDINALYKNLVYHNIVKNDFFLKYVDIQSLTTSYLKYNKGSVIGLKSAIEILQIPFQDDFHNALNDAIYTAKIFKKISPTKLSLKVFSLK